MAVDTSFGKRLPAQGGDRYRVLPPSALKGAVRFIRGHIAQAQDRLAGLDLLRLLAALLVVGFHFGYAGGTRGLMDTSFPEIAAWSKYGVLGVDLFFAISGFVIAMTAEGRTASQFAVSRALRLYPAFVVCMSLTALVALAIGRPDQIPTLKQWAANLTMFAPALGQPFMDGVYWTIVLELVFYGWVFVMIWAGFYQRNLLAIIAWWLAIAYLNEAFFQSKAIRVGLLTEYASCFASGMLIYRIRAGERRLLAFGLLGFAVGLGAMHSVEQQRIFFRLYGDTIDHVTLWTLHGLEYVLLVGAIWLSRYLTPSRLVLTLGGLTYPLYLLHQHIGYQTIDWLAPEIGRWQALGVAVALPLIAAFLVYRYVEPVGRGLMRGMLGRVGMPRATPGPLGVTLARH